MKNDDYKTSRANFRKQKLREITSENKALLSRLSSQKPFYDSKQFSREAEKHKKILKNLHRHPFSLDMKNQTSTSRDVNSKSIRILTYLITFDFSLQGSLFPIGKKQSMKEYTRVHVNMIEI